MLNNRGALPGSLKIWFGLDLTLNGNLYKKESRS